MAGSVAAGDEIVAYAVAEVGGAGGDIAAVDGDLRTADEARLVRCEEQHQIGALFWRPLAVQRYGRARRMGESLAARAEESSVGDLSGVDRIDPDVPFRELQDCGFGETAQPPFAGSVGGVVMRGESGGRGYIDNRAAAAVSDHRRAMLHAEHCTGQVDRDRTVPRLDRGSDNTLTSDCPGVIDEDMEPAETRQCARDDLLPRRLVGNILVHEHDIAALSG